MAPVLSQIGRDLQILGVQAFLVTREAGSSTPRQ